MKAKLLSEQDIINIYNKHLVVDFPEDELKPLDLLMNLYKNGNYIAFGFYKEATLMAYAFITVNNRGDYLLLDYYAVVKENRGTGIGGTCLKLMKNQLKEYKGLIIETENPLFANNSKDKEIRERRIRFYENNLLRHTGITSAVKGVEYKILVLEFNLVSEDDIIRTQLINLYKTMLPKQIYESWVIIR